jgi:signal transduction histidine kinase
LQREPDISSIIILTGEPPSVFASSNPRLLGEDLAALSNYSGRTLIRDFMASTKMKHAEYRTDSSYCYITSLKVMPAKSTEPRDVNGTVFVELNVMTSRAELSRIMVLIASGLLLLTIIMTFMEYYIISRIVLLPAKAITRTMQQRAQGDAGIRVPVVNRDEIGAIASSLNVMLDELDQEASRRSEAERVIRESEAKLKELNSAKDKYFSIIAHDLKNPFTSIMGFSSLLVSQIQAQDYEGIEKYSRMIQKSSRRAMDLLMNLLEWARSQTGRIEFNPEFVELGVLLKEVVELSADAARDKSISIIMDLPYKTPALADIAMLSTILRNLISNAVKFTWPGGEIIVSASQKNNELTVRVRDNGVGMDRETMDKLFQIEGGVSRPGTQKEKGTGLGLILCREFVEKHGGTIRVDSEPGKGSTFSFTIPSGG